MWGFRLSPALDRRVRPIAPYNFAMKLLVPLLFALYLAPAQTPGPRPLAATPAAVDPKLHADVLKLVEISGARQQVQASVLKSVPDGKKSMMEKCPNCTPEFGDEWAKRMTQRLNADEFVAVFVEEYEKYLTDADVIELISLQQNAGATPPPAPSDRLKSRMESVMPSLMGEIMGRCTEIGAKLGGQIGQEIQAEHPEYLHATPAPAKP